MSRKFTIASQNIMLNLLCTYTDFNPWCKETIRIINAVIDVYNPLTKEVPITTRYFNAKTKETPITAGYFNAETKEIPITARYFNPEIRETPITAGYFYALNDEVLGE